MDGLDNDKEFESKNGQNEEMIGEVSTPVDNERG